MKAALIAILLAGLVAPADGRPVPQDKKKQEEQLKKRIRIFKSRTNKGNPDKRIELIRDLNQPLNPGILDVLATRLEIDRTNRVLEEILKVLADYPSDARAADAIGKLLKNYDRRPGVNDKVLRTALVSFAKLRPKLTRPHVKWVNKLIDYKGLDVSVAAIEALGYIRHKDSVRPLINELLVQQKVMKGIIGTTTKGCDRG